MRQARVYFKGEEAGLLSQHDDGSFTYRYHDTWMANRDKPAISLTLPKTQQEYHADHLFPFFYHMLPEGINKQVICTYLRIDESDSFGLLLAVAGFDTIGAVTVQKIQIAA